MFITNQFPLTRLRRRTGEESRQWRNPSIFSSLKEGINAYFA